MFRKHLLHTYIDVVFVTRCDPFLLIAVLYIVKLFTWGLLSKEMTKWCILSFLFYWNYVYIF